VQIFSQKGDKKFYKVFILYSEDFIGYTSLNIEIFLLYLALAGGDKKNKIYVKH